MALSSKGTLSGLKTVPHNLKRSKSFSHIPVNRIAEPFASLPLSGSARSAKDHIIRKTENTIEEDAEQKIYDLNADEIHVLHETEEAFSFALATECDTYGNEYKKPVDNSDAKPVPTFLICHELFLSMQQGYDYLNRNQKKYGFSPETFAYAEKISKEGEFKAAYIQPDERKAGTKSTKGLVKVYYPDSRAWLPQCFEHDNKLPDIEKQQKGASLRKTINLLIAKGAKEVCLYFGELEPGSESTPHLEMEKWMENYGKFIPKNVDPLAPIIKFICRTTWPQKPPYRKDIYVVENWIQTPAYQQAKKATTELFFSKQNRGRFKSAICVDASDFRDRKERQLREQREAELREESEAHSPVLAGGSVGLIQKRLKVAALAPAPQLNQLVKSPSGEGEEDLAQLAAKVAAAEEEHNSMLRKLGAAALKQLAKENKKSPKIERAGRRGSKSGLFDASSLGDELNKNAAAAVPDSKSNTAEASITAYKT